SDDPGLHEEILEHAHALSPFSAHGALRAVLRFDPRATWQWLSTGCCVLESSMVNVNLRPWSSSALQILLSDLRFASGPRDVERLRRHTGGWYMFLQSFLRTARE